MISLFIKSLNILSSTCLNPTISVGRSGYTLTNINKITDCYFSRSLVYSENGGVIYIYNVVATMNIKRCVFFECKVDSSAKRGGAIWFSSNQAELDMVCAHSCGANYNHFACLECSNNIKMSLVSMVSCAVDYYGNHPIYLLNGIQTVVNTNCSNNRAVVISSIYFQNAVLTEMQFSNIVKNYVSHSYSIGFSKCPTTISSTNFVGCNSPLDTGVVTCHENGAVTISSSVFVDNMNTLLWVGIGSIIVDDCFISHSGLVHIGAVTIKNMIMSSIKQTYSFSHFGTIHCFVDESQTTQSQSQPQQTAA